MRLHKDAKADLIGRVPLFGECSKHELSEVASLADEIDLPDGDKLTTERSLGREFIVIVEGTADVLQDDRVINRLGAGDFVGEISLLTGAPRSATVVATSPVRALVLAHQAFRQLLADSPAVSEKVRRAAEQRRAADS